jgi:hypothetical protein
MIFHRELSSSGSDLQHLHLLVLSSYIENWRWYLKALSKEFDEIVHSANNLTGQNACTDIELG